MADFIENPIDIKSINTEIKIRDNKYKDLYLTINASDGNCTKYMIHSDSRFNVEEIQKKIKDKPENKDLKISEYKERSYLFIDTGDGKSIQVTGRKI